MLRTLLLFLTLILAGCEGALRDPVGLGGGDGGGVVTGGGGGGGGGGATGPLVGSWETTFVVQTSSDIQRHTVRWSFRSNGTCGRAVEIYSVFEDRTLTSSVSCTFQSGGGQVAITYEGRSSDVNFSWTLENFSPDRLILDGVVYDRVG
jgi:hypothetical protein